MMLKTQTNLNFT
jgi:chromosome segregation ATPase